MKKDNFKNEKRFIKDLKNIKRKRTKKELNLYKEIINIINNTQGNSKNKKLLKTLIDNIDKDIDKLNPLALTMELNVLFTKLLLLAKAKDESIPSELLVPYIDIKEEPKVWLDNLKDGVIPYLLNGNVFKVINIKGLEND